MSADYAPGQIVSVHWLGTDEWATAVVTDSRMGDHLIEVAVPGHKNAMAWNVRDVRPLVVLDLSNEPVKGDPSGRNEPTLLVHMLRETAENFFTPDAAELASKVADQIEAQTKPPRIPEPGLWGVVEAAANGSGERGQFVRTPKFWYCAQFDQARGWDALTDPTLIREGVES